MKHTSLVLATMFLVPLASAPAHACDAPCVSTKGCDAPVHFSHRYDPDDARLAITTSDHHALLILTDRVVVMQLSDRALHKVHRKLKEEQFKDDDNPLAQAFKSVVFNCVEAVLDHSAVCPLRDLREVDYRQGRLVLTTMSGKRVFEDVDVNDRNVLENFSEADARAFVQKFRSLRYQTL